MDFFFVGVPSYEVIWECSGALGQTVDSLCLPSSTTVEVVLESGLFREPSIIRDGEVGNHQPVKYLSGSALIFYINRARSYFSLFA